MGGDDDGGQDMADMALDGGNISDDEEIEEADFGIGG
jgi:hypothetical protein